MLKLDRLVLFIVLLTVTTSSKILAAPLKVGIPIKDSEPYIIEKEQKIEGMVVDIWENLAKTKNIEYELVYQDNYQRAIDAVVEGKLDIFVGPIAVTPARLEKVEFTLPIQENEVVLLSKSEAPSLWMRIKPFIGIASLSSLGILIISICIVGHLIWLAERNKNPESFPRDYVRGVSNGIWFSMVTMTTVGYGDYAPVTNMGRFISTVWMLITMLALSSITAGLASAFTLSLSNQSSPKFSGVQDLRGSTIANVRGWANGKWAIYYGANIIEVQTLDEAIGLVAENQVDGFISDRSSLTYYLKQNPQINLSISDFLVSTVFYSFALPKNSDLTNQLNEGIIEMRESTELQQIEDKWFE